MKRLLVFLAAMFLWQSANALIVSVKGAGEIPAEGLDLLVTEGENDFLTGAYTMSVQGELLSSTSAVSVHIVRSDGGLIDEFCCGSNCTAGNGELEEQKDFAVSGLASWYAHYQPVAGSDVTVRYIFSDAAETRELRVRFLYAADGVEHVAAGTQVVEKQLRNGQIRIVQDGNIYTLEGKKINK